MLGPACPSCALNAKHFFALDPPRWFCECGHRWVLPEDEERVQTLGPSPYGDNPLAAVARHQLLMAESHAVFPADRKYRYFLNRATGNPTRHGVTFLMLNPSVADETADDPTIRRCLGYAKDWGFGFLRVANLFGLVSTDPSALLLAPDPVGSFNHDAIDLATRYSTFTVLAWGAGVRSLAQAREAQVLTQLQSMGVDMRYLSRTKDGVPGHPLYLKKTAVPQPWVAS